MSYPCSNQRVKSLVCAEKRFSFLFGFRSKKLTDDSLKRVPSPKLESVNQQTRAVDDPRPDYREQYINKNPDPSEKSPFNEDNRDSPHDSFASEHLSTFDFNDLNATTTSFFSTSNNGLPTDRVDASGASESFPNSWQNSSILVRAYSKQRKQNPMWSSNKKLPASWHITFLLLNLSSVIKVLSLSYSFVDSTWFASLEMNQPESKEKHIP